MRGFSASLKNLEMMEEKTWEKLDLKEKENIVKIVKNKKLTSSQSGTSLFPFKSNLSNDFLSLFAS